VSGASEWVAPPALTKGFVGELAEVVVDRRHLAPAEDAQALGAGDLLDTGLLLTALAGIAREECQTRGVLADRGQFEICDRAQERVRHLGQDACAVTRAGIRADGAAVLEVAQRLERQRDDVVAGFATKCRDHGEAAGVLLERRVVHALLRGVGAGSAVGRLKIHQYRPQICS